MNARRSLSSAALVAAVAVAGLWAGACVPPLDQTLGVVIGDFSARHSSMTAGVTYKQQYSVRDAFAVSLAYSNPGDWDALALRADVMSFGRIPEANSSTVYAGFGLGVARWTADSPTGNDFDWWIRLLVGVNRRFYADNGEVFIELAPEFAFDARFPSTIGFTGGVRFKIGD